MDATCTIQDSIHVFNLVHKYVSRILGTYQRMRDFFMQIHLVKVFIKKADFSAFLFIPLLILELYLLIHQSISLIISILPIRLFFFRSHFNTTYLFLNLVLYQFHLHPIQTVLFHNKAYMLRHS